VKTIGWRLLPVLLFFIISVLLWRGLALDPHQLPSVQLGNALPLFKLPDLHHPDLVVDSTKFRDRVRLLNVWASWCAACIEEQVFLMQLARQGIAIEGLNYKDDPAQALLWLKKWGDPYQHIASDVAGNVAIDLGVYGAPETFIIDKHGVIRYRHAGIISQEVWTNDLLPLIQQLEQHA
jgi:cytochrome c biogenesis protein CcmG/thiol:disulfide interchange protein DsbE